MKSFFCLSLQCEDVGGWLPEWFLCCQFGYGHCWLLVVSVLGSCGCWQVLLPSLSFMEIMDDMCMLSWWSGACSFDRFYMYLFDTVDVGSFSS